MFLWIIDFEKHRAKLYTRASSMIIFAKASRKHARFSSNEGCARSRTRKMSCLKKVRGYVLLALFLSVVSTERAQEFTAFGGLGDSSGQHLSPYSWMFEYRQGIYGNLEESLVWLNEGHFTDAGIIHHRDGLALVSWYDLPAPYKYMGWSVGLGADYAFDSQGVPIPHSTNLNSLDRHLFIPVYSFDLKWYFSCVWFTRLRLTEALPVDTGKNPARFSADVGMGYYFGDALAPHSGALPGIINSFDPAGGTADWEVDALKGLSRVNTFARAGGSSVELEARYHWLANLDASLGYLYEGNSATVRRQGVIGEGWLRSNAYRLFGGPISSEIGLGVGAYACVDSKRTTNSGATQTPFLSGIVTPYFQVQITKHWFSRVEWNRVITSYSEDADIWLFGVGYRFGRDF